MGNTRERLRIEHPLGRFEQFTLLEAHMIGEQIGKAAQGVGVGDFEIAHGTLHGAMLDKRSGNHGLAACRLKVRQQEGFFLAEMRREFLLVAVPRGSTGRLKQSLIVRVDRLTEVPREFERGMVLAREFLQSG